MNNTIKFLKEKFQRKPKIGIILGSGLGDFANALENKESISYSKIPGFPTSTVEGHSGELVYGSLFDTEIVCMKGRVHFYEGFSIDDVVMPAKTLCDLGIDLLIITNAAGGVNESFTPGDLMLIEDHINFAGINPLMGYNDAEKGPRFPDMTYTYSKEIRTKAREVAEKLEIPLQEGVYMYFTGPSYETPAEIRMARVLGADAVGMSTVPEAIIANHRGIDVLGISCITNMAAGILDQPLDHNEVVEVSDKAHEYFRKFVSGCIEVLSNESY